MSSSKPLRIACAREIQKNIKESVHALIKDQIDRLGLNDQWEVQETKIFHRTNKSEFLFVGLRSLSVENIKSLEGVDIVWVEEARNVSKKSWNTLIPTIRKVGSEIWLSFNPELDTDETYVRFIKNKDDETTLFPISWRDNPWRSKVLDGDRKKMEANDPDEYLTVYEGRCRQYLTGAIYAKQIREAIAEDRITRVPYEKMKPVHTFWDLGKRDFTAIWFVQVVGFEFRIIDYIEDTGLELEDYMKLIVAKPYLWGTDWLPHDARAKRLGSRMTIEDQIKGMGRKVRITPMVSLVDGINATRTIFKKCWFDEEKCRDGLNRLKRYAYDIDENGHRSKLPDHEHSDGADAFRYFAVANQIVARIGSVTKHKVVDMVTA
jgi:phage terminase large subunit